MKCPTCRDVRMDWSYQEHYEAYHKLLEKIHEKIESLQSEIKDNHFEDCDSGHDFETHQNIEFAIEQLKSLLENKKCSRCKEDVEELTGPSEYRVCWNCFDELGEMD